MRDWRGLYGDRWGADIVPEAYAHPAKFSRALIRHIYKHIADEDWARPGDVVLDPFGGVALGGLDAGLRGLQWLGCELEPKFVALGEQNIAMWDRRFGGSAFRWVRPRILQGDSRRLLEVMDAARLLSSPPFVGVTPTADDPNYAWKFHGEQAKYGDAPGNLGNLRATDAGFAAVVSSPPYAELVNAKTHGIDWRKMGPATGNRQRGEDTAHGRTLRSQLSYGNAPGQLARMVVSSPPYQGGGHHENQIDAWGGKAGFYREQIYRLGDEQTDFWSAARQIVEQCFLALRPGGHAVWVTKRFVRNKKIVEFSDQWQAMCEAVGFRTIHRHRAWLVEQKGTQHRLDGNVDELRTERKGFFRRLAEKNGSPRIDWEDVICMERP